MPPNPAPAYAQALAAYGASRRLNQHPADVLLMVHEELRRELWAAKGAYEQNRLDQMCRHTERCMHMLFSLRAALETGATGGDGRRLTRFYDGLLTTIIGLLGSHSVSETLQRSITVLRDICAEFQKSTSR